MTCVTCVALVVALSMCLSHNSAIIPSLHRMAAYSNDSQRRDGGNAATSPQPDSEEYRMVNEGESPPVGDVQAPGLVAAVERIRAGATELSWTGQAMGLQGLRAFAQALQSHGSQMEQLVFDGGELEDYGAVVIADALPATNLHSLVLWDNRIGPKGSAAIAAALRQMTSLTTIELANNNVGNPGAKVLASALEGSQVQTIGLNRNGIRNKGAKALAEALGASRVEMLRLSHNQIGDSGMKALSAALSKSRALRTLEIAHNQVGDSGIRELAAAIGTSGLSKLVVSGNAIGPGAKTELMEAWQKKHGGRGVTGLLL